MPKVYINGKFVAQPVTGVQRFAREIVAALDGLLAEEHAADGTDFVLVVPTGSAAHLPGLKRIRVVELAGRPLHAWEQIRLPFFTRGAALVNLSGSAPLFKRRQVCTFHDAAVFDVPQAYSKAFVRWYRLLFRMQAWLCRGLLTVSEFSRARLSHHLRIAPAQFGVIPNGADHIAAVACDERVLKEHRLEPGRYLLAVGSGNPSKNFATLLEAFSTLDETSPTHLVVVGGSNDAVFAAQWPLREQEPAVVKTGRVDDARLKTLYTHARAFVFPSLYEGFGIPPLEAMMCGCAVVASDAASMPEVCGAAAGYFDPTSKVSIGQVLARVLRDDAWHTALCEAGREHVRTFTWKAAAIRLLAELRRFGIVQMPPR